MNNKIKQINLYSGLYIETCELMERNTIETREYKVIEAICPNTKKVIAIPYKLDTQNKEITFIFPEQYVLHPMLELSMGNEIFIKTVLQKANNDYEFLYDKYDTVNIVSNSSLLWEVLDKNFENEKVYCDNLSITMINNNEKDFVFHGPSNDSSKRRTATLAVLCAQGEAFFLL